MTMSHNGKIDTRTETPSGKFYPELIVENPEPITMTIAWTNSGAHVTDRTQLTGYGNLSNLPGLTMEFEDLSIVCEADGMSCPDTTKNSSTFSSDLFTKYNHTTKQGTFAYYSESNFTSIPRLIYAPVTDFPKDATIKFTITLTPKKLYVADSHNSSCGTNTLKDASFSWRGISLGSSGGYTFWNAFIDIFFPNHYFHINALKD